MRQLEVVSVISDPALQCIRSDHSFDLAPMFKHFGIFQIRIFLKTQHRLQRRQSRGCGGMKEFFPHVHVAQRTSASRIELLPTLQNAIDERLLSIRVVCSRDIGSFCYIERRCHATTGIKELSIGCLNLERFKNITSRPAFPCDILHASIGAEGSITTNLAELMAGQNKRVKICISRRNQD